MVTNYKKKKRNFSVKKPDKNHPKQVSDVNINIDGDRLAASVLRISHEGAHPFTWCCYEKRKI